MYQRGEYLMAVKLNPSKVKVVVDLLGSNSNRFTPAQLEQITGSPRRARSALFHARLSGVTLEAIRDAGRTVTAYVFNGASLPAIAATPKASKGSAKAKVAPAPKAEPAKTVKAKAAKIVKAETKVAEFNSRTKANRDGLRKAVDVSRISNEAKAAIKAKNLETMKAVSAKTKRLHPVTKRPLTDEQATILDEFAALEKQAELEEIRAEENAALRANAPAFLFKESYSE
jgi:hypothetical protein